MNTKTKLYPFSFQKHAHSIEFYRNRLFCVMCDMDSGAIPFDQKRYDRIYDMYHGELEELWNQMYWTSNGQICQLTGKQIALAKKIVAWASEQRAAACIASGKLDYVQYC